MEIGKKLKSVRFELNKTQEEIADMLGVSQAYYSTIETGKKPLTRRIKDALKQNLNVDIISESTFNIDSPSSENVVPKSINSIKAFRQSKNLTQTEFAKRLGVGRSYITQLESGKTTISERLKQRFSEVFGTSVNIIQNLCIASKGNMTISDVLNTFRDSITNDASISDHDYRVKVQTIDKIKELLKDF